MPSFYKKGALGRLVKADGGIYDDDLAEVHLTAEEYKDLQNKIRQAESDMREGIRKANQEAAAERSKYRSMLEDAEQHERNAVKAIQTNLDARGEQLAHVQADLQNEKGLNENLIRIMKERANQRRNLRPKKDHDGYIVLEMRQYTERYTEDVWDSKDNQKRYDGDSKKRATARKNGYLRIDHKTADTWQSVIQTPYDASIPLDTVSSRIKSDLGKVLQELFVRRLPQSATYKALDSLPSIERKKNYMYRWRYRANFRTGFWEMEVFTTQAFSVPEHRRPTFWRKQEAPKKIENDTPTPVAAQIPREQEDPCVLDIAEDEPEYADDTWLLEWSNGDQDAFPDQTDCSEKELLS